MNLHSAFLKSWTLNLTQSRMQGKSQKNSLSSKEKILGNTLLFQQTIGTLMDDNCATLLADLSLYSYEADFVHSLIKVGKKRLAQQFNGVRRASRWRISDNPNVKSIACTFFFIIKMTVNAKGSVYLQSG